MKRIFLFIAALALIPALCLSAMAAVNPSVKAKAAPEIVGAPVIVARDGTAVEIAVSEIVITPVSDTSGLDPEAAALLAGAFEELSSARDAASVLPAAPAGAAVSNLFDLSVSAEAAAVVAAGGELKVTLAVAGLGAGDPVFAYHKSALKGWQTVPAVNNGDGTASLTMNAFSPVAILSPATVVTDPTVYSPKTGYESGAFLAVLALCGLGGALGVGKKENG